MTRILMALALIVGLAVAPAWAGENTRLKPGDPAPAWAGLPGIDGKTHALADLQDRELVVLVFTCNSCPVAVDYDERIVALVKKYGGPKGKVAVVAVNVNTIPEDRLPKMREHAREKGFDFPYLYDASQKIAHDYGATRTPEFFVLDRTRKIAYLGAMDDKTNPALARTNYVVDAIEALLRGERPPTARTIARGCLIRYVNKDAQD